MTFTFFAWLYDETLQSNRFEWIDELKLIQLLLTFCRHFVLASAPMMSPCPKRKPILGMIMTEHDYDLHGHYRLSNNSYHVPIGQRCIPNNPSETSIRARCSRVILSSLER